MKTRTQIGGSIALFLIVGAASLSAQSCAVTRSLGNASTHAGKASGEMLASGGASVVASAQLVSGVVAVPVWMSGKVASASGEALQAGGSAVAQGAEKLWDFASGDPAMRPTMQRERAVPPVPAVPAKPVSKTKDPSPAEAAQRF